MFGIISHLLTAFGLASASGLNAYIPLLLVALAGRFTSLITLNPPFDILKNEWVIGALVVLLAIETLVDKIPAVDTINDIIQTFVRPAAGAVLFAASTNAVNLNPIIAVILGLVMAFGVHAVKATARPAVTATTAGIGNPVVSLLEDFASVLLSLIALVLPVLFVIVVIVAALFLLRRFVFKPNPSTTI